MARNFVVWKALMGLLNNKPWLSYDRQRHHAREGGYHSSATVFSATRQKRAVGEIAVQIAVVLPSSYLNSINKNQIERMIRRVKENKK